MLAHFMSSHIRIMTLIKILILENNREFDVIKLYQKPFCYMQGRIEDELYEHVVNVFLSHNFVGTQTSGLLQMFLSTETVLQCKCRG